ncbi:hypothetical protein [Microbacterium sp. GCS4]|uniref:hypothetical protein n=1 Tax=Microbacterium sp. GCS4 TaxID=1692239 RepID=UPI0006821651|nr:hypothetical protein [Microbacterium sp. GCS4]KNY04840.1 hypothetical protein AKH00_15360 [Microbacterium sp. GCS4]
MSATAAGVARSIQDATTLDGLGWRLTLPGFRVAKAFGAVLLLCGSGVASAIAVDAVSAALPATGPSVVVIGALAIGAYVVILHAVRESLTARRLQLVDHPLAGFFVAMDIPRRAVVLAECRDRLLTTGALVCGIASGVAARVIVAGASTAEVIALAAMPAAVLGGVLAITASTAAWANPHARPRTLVAVPAGVVAGLVIVAAVRLAAATAIAPTDAVAPASWTAVASVVVACAVVSAVVAAAALRAVGRSDFVAVRSEEARVTRSRLLRGSAAGVWIGVVLSDLSPLPRATALSRLAFVVWAGGTAAAEVQLTTIAAAGWQLPEVAIDRLSGVLSFVLGLTVAEMLSRWIGPAALAPRWRASWEAGASSWTLAAAPVLVAVVIGLGLTAPLAIAAAAFGGSPTVPVGVMLSALAAAWVAAAIVPAEPPRADGSSPSSLSAGVFCVITSAALAVVVLAASAAGVAALGVASSVLSLGGAAWVTRRRVLALPSRPLV